MILNRISKKSTTEICIIKVARKNEWYEFMIDRSDLGLVAEYNWIAVHGKTKRCPDKIYFRTANNLSLQNHLLGPGRWGFKDGNFNNFTRANLINK